MTAEVISFPPQGKKCKTCGFVMDRESGHDDCFCCRNTIPLPLSVPAKSGEACRECAGTGHISVHLCSDERECVRKCPQQQQCISCLGSGQTK